MKSSVKSSNTQKEILELIEHNPRIAASQMAMSIGISTRGVEKQLRTLRENGIIRRVGPDKGGYWEIVK